jgi:hypothetical protein
MNKQWLLVFFLASMFLLMGCEAHVERLAAMRKPPAVPTENLITAMATAEKPFIPAKEAVIMKQHGSTDVDFSLFVHRGSNLGYASLGNPRTSNMLSCKGVGSDPFFTFFTQPVDLNGVMNEVVKFTGRITDVQGANIGTYTCQMELYDDLENKAYDATFIIHVIK